VDRVESVVIPDKGGGRKAPPGARSRAAPGLVRLRAPGGAQDMALYIAAAKAARVRDLQAHVVTAEGKHRALALWDH
jgi:hypothetical protein